jgi:protease IV
MTLGEAGSGTRGYYLACGCDRVIVQPSATVGLTGLLSQLPFLRGTLEKLGVRPQIAHREQYKTARYLFTETEFIPPHEEAVRAVLTSVAGQVAVGIASRRSMSIDSAEQLLADGPFSAKEALEKGLVDALGYRSEVVDEFLRSFGGRARLLTLGEYLGRGGRPHQHGSHTVALIYGVGTIYPGFSRYDPMSGMLMGAQTIVQAFREAIDDRRVKAILFRVNSPGGSYVASDAIWREVARAREAGKPVVVSMGDVAASGGYFVSVAADAIVAEPATLTGSIGVVSGKMVTSELWSKLGVSWDELHTGENATMWLFTQDFTEGQWGLLQQRLDEIYSDFVVKVAAGRNMPYEQAEAAAKGRVWSGADALQLGLVDTLGGFGAAFARLRTILKLPAGAELKLKVFPKPPSLLKRVLGMGGTDISPRHGALTGSDAALIAELQKAAREAGLTQVNKGIRLECEPVW